MRKRWEEMKGKASEVGEIVQWQQVLSTGGKEETQCAHIRQGA
jgi:hypothetical protein